VIGELVEGSSGNGGNGCIEGEFLGVEIGWFVGAFDAGKGAVVGLGDGSGVTGVLGGTVGAIAIVNPISTASE